MSKLSFKDQVILIDCLRKSFLYQTPQPVFYAVGDEAPDHFVVRIPHAHYAEVMRLIQKAGGWTLPPDERRKILMAHEERARKAHGDGTDYDLSDLEHGDLYAMLQETKGITELAAFHKALGDEITARRERPVAQ